MLTMKTALLMGVLTALLMITGYIVSMVVGLDPYLVVTVAFVLAMSLNFISFWYSDKIVLKMYKAEMVAENIAPELYSMISQLSMKAGLPMPKIAVINNETFGPAEVADGDYWFPIVVYDSSYFGKTVVFYIDGVRANQTAIYPDVTNIDADRFPVVNLTVSATPPPDLGDSTMLYLMLGVLGLGVVMSLSGIYLLRRRARA